MRTALLHLLADAHITETKGNTSDDVLFFLIEALMHYTRQHKTKVFHEVTNKLVEYFSISEKIELFLNKEILNQNSIKIPFTFKGLVGSSSDDFTYKNLFESTESEPSSSLWLKAFGELNKTKSINDEKYLDTNLGNLIKLHVGSLQQAFYNNDIVDDLNDSYLNSGPMNVHAISLYVFDGQVTLFNSGSGIDLHPSRNKDLHQIAVTWKVTKRQLAGVLAVHVYFAYIYDSTDDKFVEDNGVVDFYYDMMIKFGGMKMNIEKNDWRLKESQISGSCTLWSQMFFVFSYVHQKMSFKKLLTIIAEYHCNDFLSSIEDKGNCKNDCFVDLIETSPYSKGISTETYRKNRVYKLNDFNYDEAKNNSVSKSLNEPEHAFGGLSLNRIFTENKNKTLIDILDRLFVLSYSQNFTEFATVCELYDLVLYVFLIPDKKFDIMEISRYSVILCMQIVWSFSSESNSERLDVFVLNMQKMMILFMLRINTGLKRTDLVWKPIYDVKQHDLKKVEEYLFFSSLSILETKNISNYKEILSLYPVFYNDIDDSSVESPFVFPQKWLPMGNYVFAENDEEFSKNLYVGEDKVGKTYNISRRAWQKDVFDENSLSPISLSQHEKYQNDVSEKPEDIDEYFSSISYINSTDNHKAIPINLLSVMFPMMICRRQDVKFEQSRDNFWFFTRSSMVTAIIYIIRMYEQRKTSLIASSDEQTIDFFKNYIKKLPKATEEFVNLKHDIDLLLAVPFRQDIQVRWQYFRNALEPMSWFYPINHLSVEMEMFPTREELMKIDTDLISSENFLYLVLIYIWIYPKDTFPLNWKKKEVFFKEFPFIKSGLKFIFNSNFQTYSEMMTASNEYRNFIDPKELFLLNAITWHIFHSTPILKQIKQWEFDNESVDFLKSYKNRMPDLKLVSVLTASTAVDDKGDIHTLKQYGTEKGMFSATVKTKQRGRSTETTQIFSLYDDIFGKRFTYTLLDGTILDKVYLKGIQGAFDLNNEGRHEFVKFKLIEYQEYNAISLTEKLRFISMTNSKKTFLYRGEGMQNTLEIVENAPPEFARWGEHKGSLLLHDMQNDEYYLFIRENTNLDGLVKQIRNSCWAGKNGLAVYSNYGQSDLYPQVFAVMKINRTGSNVEISNTLQAALLFRTLVLNSCAPLLRLVFDKCVLFLSDLVFLPDEDLLKKTFPHIKHSHKNEICALFEDAKAMMKNVNNPYSYYYAWKIQVLIDRQSAWLPKGEMTPVVKNKHNINLLLAKTGTLGCEEDKHRVEEEKRKLNSSNQSAKRNNARKILKNFEEDKLNLKVYEEDSEEDSEEDASYEKELLEIKMDKNKKIYLKNANDYLDRRSIVYPPAYSVHGPDDLRPLTDRNNAYIPDHKYFDVPKNFKNNVIYTKYSTADTYKGKRNRNMILFEYAFGNSLRKNQVDMVTQILTEINDRNGIEKINQLLMGQGKTSVIIPLLVLNLAGMKDFTTVVVPDILLNQTHENLIVLSGILNAGIIISRVPETTRSRPQNSTFYLQNLKGELSTVLLISDSDLKRTYLHKAYFETSENGPNFDIFEKSNFFIFDEFDTIMDPTTSSMNYPVLPVSHQALGLSKQLLETIVSACAHAIFENTVWIDYFKTNDIPKLHRQWFEFSINGAETIKRGARINPRCFSVASKIFEVLNNVLETFVFDRDFGASKTNPERMQATPFIRANTPIEDSNFSSSDIDIIATILLTLKRPFDVHMSKLIFDKMRNIHSSFSNTQNDQILNSICDIFHLDHKVGSLIFFATDEKDGSELLSKFINDLDNQKQKQIRIKLLNEIVVPSLTSSLTIDSISGYDLIKKLNTNMVGLSGTGGNFTFPVLNYNINFHSKHKSKSIDKSRIPFINAVKSQNSPLFAASPLKIIGLIKDVLIDASAILLGFKNITVAKMISRHFKQSPVIFFEDGKKFIIDNENSQPRILQNFSENAKVYFDQANCVGIDLKNQNENWNALVTFDPKASRFPQMAQAVFRMRKLPLQKITFVSDDPSFDNVCKIINRLDENERKYLQESYRNASIIQNTYTLLGNQRIEKFNIYRFYENNRLGTIFDFLLLLIRRSSKKSNRALSIINSQIENVIHGQKNFIKSLMINTEKTTSSQISTTKQTSISAKNSIKLTDNECVNLRAEIANYKTNKFSSLMHSIGVDFSENFDILNYAHDGSENSQYSYLYSDNYDSSYDAGEVLIKPFQRRSLPFLKISSNKIKVLGEIDVMSMNFKLRQQTVFYDDPLLDFISGKRISLEIFIQSTLPILRRKFHLNEILYLVDCLEQCYQTEFCKLYIIVLYFEFVTHEDFIEFAQNNLCDLITGVSCDENLEYLFNKILK